MGIFRIIPRTFVITILSGILLTGSLTARQIPRFRLNEERAREDFRRGVSFFNARQYNAAREFFYKSLALAPQFHLARNFLGKAYYYSGNWNGAIEQWEYLDEISDGAYPIVRQQSDLLHFHLTRYRNPGKYVYYNSYTSDTLHSHLRRPVQIIPGSNNSVYILGYESKGMFHVNAVGDVMEIIKAPFWNPMSGPIGAVQAGDRFYITDYKKDNVRVFDKKGYEMFTIGERGSGDGQFFGPAGIAEYNGSLYVADTGNARIQKFSLDGKYLQSFYGNVNKNPGALALSYPFDVLSDGRGRLFISDPREGRVHVLDEYGNTLELLSSPVLKSPRGLYLEKDTLIIADEKAGVIFYNAQKKTYKHINEFSEKGQLNHPPVSPYSVYRDGDGVLYVASFSADSVDLYTPRGLRTTNYDVKIESVESNTYPHMALFVTVKNRSGNFVRGLTKKEFIVYENDQRVGLLRVDNIRPLQKRSNIILVREDSAVMNTRYRWHLKEAMSPVLAPLRISDSISIVRAGDKVGKVYEGLERREIQHQLQIGDHESGGAPNLGKGLYESITDLLNKKGSRSIVLIVSGTRIPGAFDQYSVDRIVNYARAHHIQIHIISFEGENDPGNREQVLELYRGFAEKTGGVYMNAFDESSIRDLYGIMQENKDKRYIITYKSLKDARIKNRYMDVKVEVRHMGTSGLGDGGYFTP